MVLPFDLVPGRSWRLDRVHTGPGCLVPVLLILTERYGGKRGRLAEHSTLDLPFCQDRIDFNMRLKKGPVSEAHVRYIGRLPVLYMCGSVVCGVTPDSVPRLRVEPTECLVFF